MDKQKVNLHVEEYYGTRDHSKMNNRNQDDQHPISAITGLEDRLENIETYESEFATTKADLQSTVKEIESDMNTLEAKNQDTLANLSNMLTAAQTVLDNNRNNAVQSIQDAGATVLDAVRDSTDRATTAMKSALAAEDSVQKALNGAETVLEALQNKLDKPSGTPTAGQVLMVNEVKSDGTIVLEWADI